MLVHIENQADGSSVYHLHLCNYVSFWIWQKKNHVCFVAIKQERNVFKLVALGAMYNSCFIMFLNFLIQLVTFFLQRLV